MLHSLLLQAVQHDTHDGPDGGRVEHDSDRLQPTVRRQPLDVDDKLLHGPAPRVG